jgi:hypothetical protein
LGFTGFQHAPLWLTNPYGRAENPGLPVLRVYGGSGAGNVLLAAFSSIEICAEADYTSTSFAISTIRHAAAEQSQATDKDRLAKQALREEVLPHA